MILSPSPIVSGRLSSMFPGVRAMAGIVFAVFIGLATILCVALVMRASEP
jgi:hypothetical protein